MGYQQYFRRETNQRPDRALLDRTEGTSAEQTARQRRRLTRGISVLALLLVVSAYLLLLGFHSAGQTAALLIVYRGQVAGGPVPGHPRTGLLLWAPRQNVEAEIASIVQRRAKMGLSTLTMDAGPHCTPSIRELEQEGLHLVLAQVPVDGDQGSVSRKLLADLEQIVSEHEPDLVVVATAMAPDLLLRSIDLPLAILPGAFSPSVPGRVEVRSQGRLVAPWVDSRHRLGELEVEPGGPGEPPSLHASTFALPSAQATADDPSTLGWGPETLFHDTIHFGQQGMGMLVARLMLRYTGADLALLNYLSIRAGLVGEVDAIDLEEAFPFHNQVELLTMTGQQLVDVLAVNVMEDTRYLLVAGWSQGVAGAWLDASGVPVSPQKEYRLATVDYLANGARGRQPLFLEGRDRLPTGLYTDRLVLDLLQDGPEEMHR